MTNKSDSKKKNDDPLVDILTNLIASTGLGVDYLGTKNQKSKDHLRSGVESLVNLYHANEPLFYTMAAVALETASAKIGMGYDTFLGQLMNYCAEQSPYLQPKNANADYEKK